MGRIGRKGIVTQHDDTGTTNKYGQQGTRNASNMVQRHGIATNVVTLQTQGGCQTDRIVEQICTGQWYNFGHGRGTRRA